MRRSRASAGGGCAGRRTAPRRAPLARCRRHRRRASRARAPRTSRHLAPTTSGLPRAAEIGGIVATFGRSSAGFGCVVDARQVLEADEPAGRWLDRGTDRGAAPFDDERRAQPVVGAVRQDRQLLGEVRDRRRATPRDEIRMVAPHEVHPAAPDLVRIGIARPRRAPRARRPGAAGAARPSCAGTAGARRRAARRPAAPCRRARGRAGAGAGSCSTPAANALIRAITSAGEAVQLDLDPRAWSRPRPARSSRPCRRSRSRPRSAARARA